MSGAAPDPGDLAGEVLEHRPGAVERLWRAEHPRVWRLCLGLVADPEEADDLAQDAMLHLIDRIERWDPGRPWGAWRDAVVVNLCRDRLRRIEARRRAERRVAEESAAGEREAALLPHPGLEAERAESMAAVVAALGALSPREREAFVLRELEGRATSEVAAALGIEEGSVRSLLALARRRLRQLLAPRLDEAAGGRDA